jgi:hypothetical protein
MKIVNGTVPESLTRLGYSDAERADILSFIDKNDTIEGAPISRKRISRSSIAPSSRPRASAPSSTWATSA